MPHSMIRKPILEIKTQFMKNADDQDEVSFWLGMIRLWEASHSEPVPKRMREALELAENRFRQIQGFFSSQNRRPH